MFHAGLALELSRIIWNDRRAEARAGRGRSGRRPSSRSRSDGTPASVQASAPMSNAGEDPWWAWRVVEPDTAYLRRRAA